jgi:enoyl-CoA hydratase
VASITLNRPGGRNALNLQMMGGAERSGYRVRRGSRRGRHHAAGSEKAFAAGADIKEMSRRTFSDFLERDWMAAWSDLSRVRKPLVAAVSGYAWGGGCELAMMCDVLIASETAQFGQPETRLGLVPGLGGSQRLTHAIGKANAMGPCLTGRTVDAAAAEHVRLISRLVPGHQFRTDGQVVLGSPH